MGTGLEYVVGMVLMILIKSHKVYELLKSKYTEIAIDYVIMSIDTNYKGIDTHKQAVLEAFRILNEECDEERMAAVSYSMDELLQLPAADYFDNRQKVNRAFSIPNPTPYWYAFFEPPYGTRYLKQDFIDFNRILFPNVDKCEVFRWNDDFSDYFDAGKEWWGTGLWTIFDCSAKTIVVIGASLTD